MSDVEEIQPDIEARVLGQILCSKAALVDADDLEVFDFQLPMNQQAMAAIRELQLRNEPVDVAAVIDEMELKAAEHGHVVRSCDYAAAVATALMAEPYGLRRESFLADMRFLHKIAVSRREASRAA